MLAVTTRLENMEKAGKLRSLENRGKVEEIIGSEKSNSVSRIDEE